MNWDLLGLVAFIVTIIGVIALFYLLGRANGVAAESSRVQSLCHQAVLKRNSGSVKWVWNAVTWGRRELMPEEEFFGPLTQEERSKRSER